MKRILKEEDLFFKIRSRPKLTYEDDVFGLSKTTTVTGVAPPLTKLTLPRPRNESLEIEELRVEYIQPITTFYETEITIKKDREKLFKLMNRNALDAMKKSAIEFLACQLLGVAEIKQNKERLIIEENERRKLHNVSLFMGQLEKLVKRLENCPNWGEF